MKIKQNSKIILITNKNYSARSTYLDTFDMQTLILLSDINHRISNDDDLWHCMKHFKIIHISCAKITKVVEENQTCCRRSIQLVH